jgi:hypothetical protein
VCFVDAADACGTGGGGTVVRTHTRAARRYNQFVHWSMFAMQCSALAAHISPAGLTDLLPQVNPPHRPTHLPAVLTPAIPCMLCTLSASCDMHTTAISACPCFFLACSLPSVAADGELPPELTDRPYACSVAETQCRQSPHLIHPLTCPL